MKTLTKRACTDRTSNLRTTSPSPQKKLICNAVALCSNCFLSLDCLFMDILMCCQFNVPWDTSLRTTRQDVQAKPRSATQLRSTGRLCHKSISHRLWPHSIFLNSDVTNTLPWTSITCSGRLSKKCQTFQSRPAPYSSP